VVPSGLERSAIVITRRYIRTALAFFSVPVVILGICANQAMIDSSPSRCRGGAHDPSIHNDPFISDSLSLIEMRKLLSMYFIGVVVFWSISVTSPEISWRWSRVTSMSFATVLSHLSCFMIYGIWAWSCMVYVSGKSIPPMNIGPYSTAPGKCLLSRMGGRKVRRINVLILSDCWRVKLVRTEEQTNLEN
jgi:hypothetical protein